MYCPVAAPISSGASAPFSTAEKAVTVFTKNHERLLAADVAKTLFAEALAQARSRELLSSEHFTVDGTRIEAWADGIRQSCGHKCR